MRRRLQRLLGLLAVFGVAAGGAAQYGTARLDAPGPLASPADIMVPRGPTATVAGALQRAGVIGSAWPLRIAAVLTAGQGTLRAGEFAFPAGASLRTTLAILREAPPVQHRLTVAEGLTVVQIAALIAAEPALSGPVPPIMEGDLLPQTYFFVRETPRAIIVARGRDAMARALSAAWEGRDPGLPLLNADALRTLASLVERETAREDERPLVAAVLINRLKLGMKLQSDPTVAFVVSGGAGTLNRRLTRADLATASPFNTYWAPALPPGPICAPGAASLRAVAHPAATDALYFVADGTGGHSFARTLSEHNRNVARLRSLDAPQRGSVVEPRCEAGAMTAACGTSVRSVGKTAPGRDDVQRDGR